MKTQVKIGIIGEYNPKFHFHGVTRDALAHAADALSLPVELSWIRTRLIARESPAPHLKGYDGIMCPPGDYEHIQGALNAAKFARETGRPFIGT